jgi:transposase-like protein
MNPSEHFCTNLDCPLRGLTQQGNLWIHSRHPLRLRCKQCGMTFRPTKNTPFYRLQYEATFVTQMVALISYGCPLQAIVQVFHIEERTLSRWCDRAGDHAQQFHQSEVQTSRVDTQHVQADELQAKLPSRQRVWMAMAIATEFRLWLGGVVSPNRDRALIYELALLVKSCVKYLGILLCVDGLKSYVSQFLRVFRHGRTLPGGGGRLEIDADFQIAQGIKRRQRGRCVEIVRRVVRGSWQKVMEVLHRTQTGQQIHTAYIERLNGMFRSWLHGLVRRGRQAWYDPKRLEKGMWLVGVKYNYCRYHSSLKEGKVQSTPAMAAGLTDRQWTLQEVLEKRQIPTKWEQWDRAWKRRRQKQQTKQKTTLHS